MIATKLATRRLEKPWGRTHLFPGFPDPAPGEPPIGEVWFQTADDTASELLVKYLFTGETLSVQVHPNDAQARAAGEPRGKDECWFILSAEPDARIAIGTTEPLGEAQLRAAALDGSIEGLLDWKRVKAGDFYYSPANTIHAIGAGITMIEVQQNSDTTYRLYDYGRPRALHLDQGVMVADAVPWVAPTAPGEIGAGRTILVEGPKFVLERWSGEERSFALPDGTQGWLVVVAGEGSIGGVDFAAGECLTVTGSGSVRAIGGSDLLFAYPGTVRMLDAR